jgi:pSer/pThr/pTyr-binding forkhead associated (FHA) protein
MTLPGVPALIGLQGIAAGSTFALTAGDLTIGRDGENEIVLAENTVSRQHARVLRDGQGQFTLTDLGSANGVYVNGMRVQRAILSMGDEIKIGDNYFRFQSEKEP